MSGLYLRPLDPLDPHGLLAPSPGGGRVPIVAQRHCGTPWAHWRTMDAWGRLTSSAWPEGETAADVALIEDWPMALLLRTASGEVDPIGMSRAREVLARVEGLDPSIGVQFQHAEPRPWCLPGWMLGDCDGFWFYRFDSAGDSKVIPLLAGLDRPEDAPEALAAILAHLGVCEVVRG